MWASRGEPALSAGKSTVEAVPFDPSQFSAVCHCMRTCGLALDECLFRRHFLTSPLSAHSQDALRVCGITLVDGKKVVGFQGLVVREIYRGQERMSAYEMGVLGIDPAYRLYAPLLTRMMRQQADCCAFYGNTSSPQASRMYKAFGFHDGSDSCARICFHVCDWTEFIRVVVSKSVKLKWMPSWLIPIVGAMLNAVWRVVKPVPYEKSDTTSRLLSSIEFGLFDNFWKCYLQNNIGLVSSRHPDVLNWLFDEELRQGNNLLIGRFKQNILVGYLVLRRNALQGGASPRYVVADWIALENDPLVLGDLLLDAIRHVQAHGGAVVELIGYPESVQTLIAKYLPLHRKTATNTFIYKTTDSAQMEEFAREAASGWFWGAFDADRCVMS